MAAIRVDTFGGMAPLIDPKKLPAGGAQVAARCVFEASDLRPLREPLPISWTGIPASPTRIYQWKGRWLGWAGSDVDVVASPVPNDSHERLYWSRGAGLKPRFADRNTLIGSVNMTSLGRDLGVTPPSDIEKPQIVVASIEDVLVDAAAMSQTSPVRVSTATDHPFEGGQRVVVTLFRTDGAPDDLPDTPPERTGMVEMNGKEFVVREVKNPDSNIVSLREFDLIGADGANYSEYEPAKWTATIKRVFSDDDMDSRSYVYTYVSTYGEESQPSPPSDVVDVLNGAPCQVKLQPSVAALAAGYTVRLYRSVTGASGTYFFLVKESALVAPYTLTDDVEDVSLGELLPSETWAPPPEGLAGLCAMPNGFFAGFVGNTLYFSEPYQPHAWPFQYTRTTQDEIVGIAVFGQNLVVATKGKPYLASGVDPSSVTLAQLDIYAPCLAKATVVSVGSGVVFASRDGLIHVSSSGARVLTEGVYTKRQWEALVSVVPVSCIWHDNRFFMSGVSGGRTIIFEPTSSGLNVSEFGATYSAMAVSTGETVSQRDVMTVVPSGASTLYRFNAGNPMQAAHIGRVNVLPAPVSLSCGQVYAAGYPVMLYLHAGRVTANQGQPGSLVYPDSDSQMLTVTVSGPEPFRLPGGFMAREWRVDIGSSFDVQSFVLATTMDEIRQQ